MDYLKVNLFDQNVKKVYQILTRYELYNFMKIMEEMGEKRVIDRGVDEIPKTFLEYWEYYRSKLYRPQDIITIWQNSYQHEGDYLD